MKSSSWIGAAMLLAMATVSGCGAPPEDDDDSLGVAAEELTYRTCQCSGYAYGYTVSSVFVSTAQEVVNTSSQSSNVLCANYCQARIWQTGHVECKKPTVAWVNLQWAYVYDGVRGNLNQNYACSSLP